MVKIPHREDPGDPTEDGWDRLYAPTPAAPYWPEVEITDNPIVAVLLDADGEPPHMGRTSTLRLPTHTADLMGVDNTDTVRASSNRHTGAVRSVSGTFRLCVWDPETCRIPPGAEQQPRPSGRGCCAWPTAGAR